MANISSYQRLHDQSLNSPDEESGRSLVIKLSIKLTAGLSLFKQTIEALPITADERLRHPLGRGFFRSLQFTKQHTGNTRVLCYKVHMRHKHAFECGKRRGLCMNCFFNAGH